MENMCYKFICTVYITCVFNCIEHYINFCIFKMCIYELSMEIKMAIRDIHLKHVILSVMLLL